MSKQKMDKEQRQEILLTAIYLFYQYSRKEEVSRSELVDCLTEFQKGFPTLGYEFPEKNPYLCHQLSEDLNDLWFNKGYLRHYQYGLPLPKNFVALWPLGKGHGKKIIETLSSEISENLNRSVKNVIKKQKKDKTPI